MSLTDNGAHYEVRQELTSILKVYNGFARLVVLKEPYSFHRYDYDQPSRHRFDDEPKSRFKVPESTDEIQQRDEWRAKTKITDLAVMNEFDIFATFTFKDKRYDVDTAKRRMATWLNNQRGQYGKFRYLIVAEYHKDGALHFHALLGGYKGVLVDRGHIDPKDVRKKYDIDSYKLGIATAKKIDATLEDKQKVAGYVAKYITKDMPKFHGKQRYWRSNGLRLPRKISNPLLTNKDKERFIRKAGNEKHEIFEMHGNFTEAELDRISNHGQVREDLLIVLER